jgi:hypothetical protein
VFPFQAKNVKSLIISHQQTKQTFDSLIIQDTKMLLFVIICPRWHLRIQAWGTFAPLEML